MMRAEAAARFPDSDAGTRLLHGYSVALRLQRYSRCLVSIPRAPHLSRRRLLEGQQVICNTL
jgi:hypothetical protein